MGVNEKQTESFLKTRSVQEKLSALQHEDTQKNLLSPDNLIKEWKLKKDSATLEKIHTCLKTAPIKWVEEFLNNYDGLTMFSDSLKETNLFSDK
jgi:hypothetical protein